MESLIVTVVDRLIQLLTRREEVGRASYDDAVVPLIAAVDLLHQHYLKSFREYRDMLVTDPASLRGVLDRVGADSLFSRDLRSQVKAQLGTISDPSVAPLLRAVRSYTTLAMMNPLAEWRDDVEFMPELSKRRDPSEFDVITPVAYDELDETLIARLSHSRLLTYENPSRRALLQGVSRFLERGGVSVPVLARFAIRLVESVVIELQRRYAVIGLAHSDVRMRMLHKT